MLVKEQRIQNKSDATLRRRRTTFAHTLELLTSVLLHWPHTPDVESPSLLLAGPSGNGKSYLVHEAFNKARHIMSTAETAETQSHLICIKPSLAEIITIRKMDGSTALRSELRESITRCCKIVKTKSSNREVHLTKSSNRSMTVDNELCSVKSQQTSNTQDQQALNSMHHASTSTTKAKGKTIDVTSNKNKKEISVLVILDHLEYFLLQHSNENNTEDTHDGSDEFSHSFSNSHHASHEHGTGSHNAKWNISTSDHSEHSADHSAHVAHPELITDLYHVLQSSNSFISSSTTTAALFSSQEVQHLHLRRVIFVGLFSAELNSLLSFARVRLFRLCITLSTPTEEERRVFFASHRKLSRCDELVNALASRSGGMTYGALVEIVNIVQSMFYKQLLSLVCCKADLERENNTHKRDNEECHHGNSTQCFNESTNSDDNHKPVTSLEKAAEYSFRAQVSKLAQNAVKSFQTSSSSNAAYYRESAGYVDVQETRWDDIAGMQSVKRMLQELITAPLHRKKLYDTFHVRPSTGVLLHGPPGTGKTMLARAMATELNASFIYLDLPQLLQCEVGESERKLSDFFNLARERSPTVMFIDEIQAAFGVRFAEGNGKHNNQNRSDYNSDNNNNENNLRAMSSSHDARLVSHFLHLLDVAHEDNAHPILFVGATNVITMLDPQLLRAGRLDIIVEVPLPDSAARRALIRQIVFGDWSRWFASGPTEASLELNSRTINKSREDSMSMNEMNEMAYLHMSMDEQNALLNAAEPEKVPEKWNEVHVADVQNVLVDNFVELSDGLSGAALRNAANTFALRFVQFVVNKCENSTNVNTGTKSLCASTMNLSKESNSDIDSKDKAVLCNTPTTMLMRSLICTDSNKINNQVTLTSNVITLLQQAVSEQKKVVNYQHDSNSQIELESLAMSIL